METKPLEPLPLIIYHFPCNDGFGAALSAWMKFGPAAEYLPWNYHREEEFRMNWLEKCRDRNVYVLDFSFRPDLMRDIINTSKHFVLLDHHKTVFEELGGDPGQEYRDEDEKYYIHLHPGKSGAYLAWEYFLGHEPPVMIKHLDDYDRWQFNIPFTREFDRMLRSHPFDFQKWKDILFMSATGSETDDRYMNLISEGRALLRAHQQMVENLAKSTRRPIAISLDVGTEPIRGLGANVPGAYASDVGHILAEESGTFALTWYIRYDGKVSCSLRAPKDGMDVSAIARRFGGGGHAGAAGFETSHMQMLEWLTYSGQPVYWADIPTPLDLK